MTVATSIHHTTSYCYPLQSKHFLSPKISCERQCFILLVLLVEPLHPKSSITISLVERRKLNVDAFTEDHGHVPSIIESNK